MKIRLNHTTSNFLVYPLMYATLVTVLTIVLSYWPTFLHMEYAIYDPMQKMAAELETFLDKPEVDIELKNFVGINLDPAFFDLETERVKRGKLADFLNTINSHTNPRGVFLDFLFVAKGESPNQDDERLIKSLESFNAPIVLPNDNAFDTTYFWETLTVENVIKGKPLLWENQYSGHVAFRLLTGDESYRYLPFSIKNSTHHSVVHQLLKATDEKDIEKRTLDIPDRIEVNYILHQLEEGHICDASALLKFDKDRLADTLSNKIVFIGLFSKRKDIYNNSIDKFRTPLKGETSGIYLIINAYLNISSGTFFKKACWMSVFLFNFLIGFFGAKYYLKNQRDVLKSRRKIFGEIFLSSLFFFLFLGILYCFWCVKFPFVITTLIYVLNQVTFKYYLKVTAQYTIP